MADIPDLDALDWKPHSSGLGGEQARIAFPNGYGASVLRGTPYGYCKGGTYEIAVLDSNGDLTYDTPVTDDVLGYLSDAEATQALADIAALPRVEG